MATPTTFRDLRAWQTAMQLAVDIYHLAGNLPPTERPGLSTNMQQTATAIPTLIATGHKTRSRTGMLSFSQKALGSCYELETLLEITGQLYPNVPSNDLLDQLDEVQQLLVAIVEKLGQTPHQAKPAPRKTV
jgi:four helix bundle protein